MYETIVRLSDIVLFCGIDGKKMSYVIQDAEKPSKSCTFFVSILLLNGISLKTISGYT